MWYRFGGGEPANAGRMYGGWVSGVTAGSGRLEADVLVDATELGDVAPDGGRPL